MGKRPERSAHEKAYAPGARGAVELHAVTRRYGRSVHALRGIDLALPYGSFTAVMGPSGSGKSTFLQCAAGLDRPTSGTVRLGGTEITALSENKLTALRRSRLGFVFQAFNLLPSLTVEQNVMLPLRLAGRRPDRRRAAHALAQVGLHEHGKRRPDQLSGGQQQRVALARALITSPDVIFADEPTGALDTTTAAEVLALLRTAATGTSTPRTSSPRTPVPGARTGGTGSPAVTGPDAPAGTVVMVTHDPAAAAYADRVLFLADGSLVDSLERRPEWAPARAAEEIAARMTGLAAHSGPHAPHRPRAAA